MSIKCVKLTQIGAKKGSALGSLSNNVFERRTSTGSDLFSFFAGGFAQILSQIASITVKKLRNTNFISSRHVKRENTSLPVDVRRSKTSLLKLPNDARMPFSLIYFFAPISIFYIPHNYVIPQTHSTFYPHRVKMCGEKGFIAVRETVHLVKFIG